MLWVFFEGAVPILTMGILRIHLQSFIESHDLRSILWLQLHHKEVLSVCRQWSTSAVEESQGPTLLLFTTARPRLLASRLLPDMGVNTAVMDMWVE